MQGIISVTPRFKDLKKLNLSPSSRNMNKTAGFSNFEKNEPNNYFKTETHSPSSPKMFKKWT